MTGFAAGATSAGVGRRAAVTCLVAFLAMLLAGCSGVPDSSAPQNIQSVGQRAGQGTSVAPPARNLTPREIVYGFLAAESPDTAGHDAARGYLTAAANKAWQPDAKTTIVTSLTVGTYSPSARNLTLTASGQAIGTLTAQGIYAPNLVASGNGGPPLQFGFGLVRLAGQWRINTLSQSGLVLDQSQFAGYQQRPIYYFDAAGRYLVPDVRYSAIVDRTALSDWLLSQLVGPPRAELQNAVSADSVPAQQHRLTVVIGSKLTKVLIPGSASLDAHVLNRAAAQVALTLDDAGPQAFEILDGTKPVSIPQLKRTRFTAADFTAQLGPAQPDRAVYYVNDGKIYNQSGQLLAGHATGKYYYRSVAVARPDPRRGLAVAGVIGTGQHEQLVVGNADSGMALVKGVSGQLSRPSWAPGRAEVWIGDGSQVTRVVVTDKGAVATNLPISFAAGGRIIALRFSPDGARIALVVSGSNGRAQLFVSSVVRVNGVPQVVGGGPISPAGVEVTDVAWSYALKLAAIGMLGGEAHIFETGVDGAHWTEQGITGLPGDPTSVTLATGAPIWVSANGYVWIQTPTSGFSPPGSVDQAQGTNPTYLE